jgi:hypothetical protein
VGQSADASELYLCEREGKEDGVSEGEGEPRTAANASKKSGAFQRFLCAVSRQQACTKRELSVEFLWGQEERGGKVME